jgi:opacity protein-like surface antigen
MLRRMHQFAGALLMAVALAPATQAAEFYASGEFMQSLGRDNSSGTIATSLPITVLGSDGDSSLGYGLAVGFGFEFEEVLPKKWNSWGTAFRIESEFVYGREWEFVSNTEDPTGVPLPHHFFNEVKAWSFMPVNLYIDVPLRRPMSKIFGRVPMLEPVDLSFGFGAGVSHVHINAFDNIGEAVDGVYKFAFQGNVALSYEFSERTKLQFGYRYLDLGATDANLVFVPRSDPPTAAGLVDLDLKAHEFVLSARYAFHQKPLEDMHFPLPRWLTGDDSRPPPKAKKPGKKRDWFKLPRWLGGKRGP